MHAEDSLFETQLLKKTSTPVTEVSYEQNSPTLSQVTAMFIEDRKRREVDPQTIRDYGSSVSLFTTFLGQDLPISEISKKLTQEYQGLLLECPSNMSKSYKTGNIRKAVAMAREKDTYAKLDPRTVNKQMERLSAIFNYAKRAGLMRLNPAVDLRVPLSKNARYLPFEKDDLNKIFASRIYTSSPKEDWSAPQWIPLIALYSGMRLNEICQLSLEDLKTYEGIHYIHVTEDSTFQSPKKLKNQNSERYVPLHNHLLQLGILQYKAKIQADGHQRLFPTLSYSESRGSFAVNFSKDFRKELSAIKVKRKQIVFHSFRHTFRDAMRNARIPTEHAEAIGGWKSTNSLAYHYGGGIDLVPTLSEEINRVTYTHQFAFEHTH
ncbi:tyrosine-type recombinase/integrase [Pelagicoccus mobilis]|uniref:Tyrosine-type recombinase/integrase n=1 Tax=Pelagicoccus mobilis TaxID=415221 RepID=A0A934VL06_9BACT|nr:tyrosine-type recombinase/integrase [Pelagicoccus mobilis]MBK1877251.1 tyrosine-type recombinase/integrase [Pelagicoccus mobilis]